MLIGNINVSMAKLQELKTDVNSIYHTITTKIVQICFETS